MPPFRENCYRHPALAKKWEREISLEYLMYEKHFPITDWRDFVTAELDEERLLTACGLSVMLDNEELAVALSHLSGTAGS